MMILLVPALLAAIAATPLPMGSPQSTCPPNGEATVTDATSPEYPDSARDLGTGPVTVIVDVTVSPAGNVTNINLAQSSNNAAIDVAAMSAALHSKYRPKIVACKGVVGHYLFRAEFNPD
jgi:TonB family protein